MQHFDLFWAPKWAAIVGEPGTDVPAAALETLKTTGLEIRGIDVATPDGRAEANRLQVRMVPALFVEDGHGGVLAEGSSAMQDLAKQVSGFMQRNGGKKA